MPRIKELNPRVRQVLSKCLCSWRDEKRIILAPDRKQWRPRLSKIFLELRIKPHVRRIVQKQIELNLFVSWPFQQSPIQCVRLRRNAFWIGDALRVLPTSSFQCQDVLADYPPVICRGLSPILPDGGPGVTEPFFVGVSILRNYGCDSFRVGHGQPETRWRAIVEYIDGISVESKCLRERLHRRGQVIERVNILSVGRNLREPKARKIRSDHAVFSGEPRNELSEHER